MSAGFQAGLLAFLLDYRIEFDEKQRILLIAFNGDVTETSFLTGISVAREFMKKNRIQEESLRFLGCSSDPGFRENLVGKLAISDVFVLSASDVLRVIVAPQPSIFGLARMFEMYRESAGKAPTVVRDMPEALKFLNVESRSDLKSVK